MYMLISVSAFAFVMLVLFVGRKRISLFWSASIFYAATAVYMKWGFDPPVPSSIVGLFNATNLIAVLLYVSSSEDGRKAFFGPIMAMMVEKRLWLVRWCVLLLVPALLAWQGYQSSLPQDAPPPRIRMVHPPPPNTIDFISPADREEAKKKPRKVDLIKEDNPLRALEGTAEFAEKIAHGKTVYYQNCFYCHGDQMAADGHLAGSVRPPPADFTDPGTLPMLQESFLFWRIAKGGPGLPAASTPWDSTMPVWEKFLTEDDIWAVILYLYDHTGFQPRARVEVAH